MQKLDAVFLKKMFCYFFVAVTVYYVVNFALVAYTNRTMKEGFSLGGGISNFILSVPTRGKMNYIKRMGNELYLIPNKEAATTFMTKKISSKKTRGFALIDVNDYNYYRYDTSTQKFVFAKGYDHTAAKDFLFHSRNPIAIIGTNMKLMKHSGGHYLTSSDGVGLNGTADKKKALIFITIKNESKLSTRIRDAIQKNTAVDASLPSDNPPPAKNIAEQTSNVVHHEPTGFSITGCKLTGCKISHS